MDPLYKNGCLASVSVYKKRPDKDVSLGGCFMSNSLHGYLLNNIDMTWQQERGVHHGSPARVRPPKPKDATSSVRRAICQKK